MKKKNTLLIIGAGFVGGTCYKAFRKLDNWNICINDKQPKGSFLEKELPNEDINWKDIEFAAEADLFFCAVPTPMIKETGACHTKILESVIRQIRSFNKNSWICIKSTVPPGTTQRLSQEYGRVCFNPEFLTEANALEDFVTLPYQFIGYPEVMSGVYDSLDDLTERLYLDAYEQRLVNGGNAVISMSSTEAEMIKYTRNSYLATRLSFFNEIKQICDKLEIDYKHMKHYAGYDQRVGQHYNDVNEENPGYGGHCIVKDPFALIDLASRLGVKPTVLAAVMEKNLEVRKFRDWEQMENRAIITES